LIGKGRAGSLHRGGGRERELGSETLKGKKRYTSASSDGVSVFGGRKRGIVTKKLRVGKGQGKGAWEKEGISGKGGEF